MKQLALGVTLRANAVFANFCVGDNAEVVAALERPTCDALWLYGQRGSGKTHLLQAVCAATQRSTVYLPLGASHDAPGASLDAPSAVPQTLPPQVLRGLAGCDTICIDDVGAVAGDLAWEEALFQLYNEASESGSRLIFAADAAPRQIGWRLEDWRSRAGAGVVYQLKELDEAGRLQALRLRARQRGIDLPAETLDYLIRRMPRDLRSLFDLLDELDEASLAAQRRLTVPFIRDALEKRAGTKS